MLKRIISGLIMAVGVIYVLTQCEAVAMHCVISIIALIAASEFHAMSAPNSLWLNRLSFVASVACLALYPLLEVHLNWSLELILPCVFIFTALKHLAQPSPLHEATNRLSHDILGLAYLGSTIPFLFHLRGTDHEQTLISSASGGWVLLMVIVITALSDTGGYFAGRAFGKHKLFEAVSPKKTVEGAIGGLLCAVGGCFVMRNSIDMLGNLRPIDCVALGVLGTAASIVGDLVESLMKRGYGVKDSGNIIPGHGGVLDRIDALLFSAPIVFLYWKAAMA